MGAVSVAKTGEERRGENGNEPEVRRGKESSQYEKRGEETRAEDTSGKGKRRRE